jgi:hypothetical protein
MFAMGLNAVEQASVQQPCALGESSLWRADGQFLTGKITVVIGCKAMNGMTFGHDCFLKTGVQFCFRRCLPVVLSF